jgi:uncharacterized protein YlxP (DUF503 family)
MTTISTKLVFYIPHSQSLKDKRQVSRSIIDKTKGRFNLSIAEVDTRDVIQTLTIGIAVVSGEYYHAKESTDKIIRFIEEHIDAELVTIEEE